MSETLWPDLCQECGKHEARYFIQLNHGICIQRMKVCAGCLGKLQENESFDRVLCDKTTTTKLTGGYYVQRNY